MRILIIGGTSFIGPHVVDQLNKSNNEIILFHRHEATRNLSVEVQHIHGNRRELTEFSNELRQLKPDIVLDMIPVVEKDAVDLMEVFSGTARRVVAISSQDVYKAYGKMINIEPGSPEKTPLTEDSPLRQKLYPYRGEEPRTDDDPYKILDDYDKILIEIIVMSDTDLPGTVLRLPMVYGPFDTQHRLFDQVKRMKD